MEAAREGERYARNLLRREESGAKTVRYATHIFWYVVNGRMKRRILNCNEEMKRMHCIHVMIAKLHIR